MNDDDEKSIIFKKLSVRMSAWAPGDSLFSPYSIC